MTLGNWYQCFNLLIFDEIDSTNEESKRLIRGGATGEFVIWAKNQTSSKGMDGKEWFSSKDNLSLSVLFRPKYDLVKASQMPFIVAVAIGSVFASSLNDSIKLSYKWPNDILINDKIVATILIESGVKPNSQELDWLVIGISVNIADKPNLTVNNQFTSLVSEGINQFSSDKLIDKIMKSLCYWIDFWEDEGFEAIRTAWLSKVKGIGSVITASVGLDRVSGVFQDITEEGQLRLTLAGGQECLINSGDVYYDFIEYKNYSLRKI